MLLGNLKLLRFYEDDHVALFDLSNDIGERNDLSAKLITEATDLRRKLEDELKSIDAQMPEPNPQYDPEKPSEPERGKRSGKGKKAEKKKEKK